MAFLFAVDSSIIVASLLTWHEHHNASAESFEEAMNNGPVLIPAPALVESYAVMTRLPSPHRLSPKDAHLLLQQNFMKNAQTESLTGDECWAMLTFLASHGIAGGRTYDAKILTAAIKGRAKILLTLNTKDFISFSRGEIEIRSPLECH